MGTAPVAATGIWLNELQYTNLTGNSANGNSGGTGNGYGGTGRTTNGIAYSTGGFGHGIWINGSHDTNLTGNTANRNSGAYGNTNDGYGMACIFSDPRIPCYRETMAVITRHSASVSGVLITWILREILS